MFMELVLMIYKQTKQKPSEYREVFFPLVWKKTFYGSIIAQNLKIDK